MPSPDTLIPIDSIGPSGSYRTRRHTIVKDVRGVPTLRLSLIPRLFLWRSISAMHKAAPKSVEKRAEILAKAGEIFSTESIDGMSPDTYQRMVSRICGLPLYMARKSTEIIAESAIKAYQTSAFARPLAAVDDWRAPQTLDGGAVWVRRGNIFGVLASGNTPSVHSLWLEALALGYKVVVRPSQREPLTPYRLIRALHMAGFDTDQIMFLPTNHAEAEDIVEASDLSIVYGGDAMVQKYHNRPTVLTEGPGRSKILITEDAWQESMDMIIESVAGKGATNCINTTAIFVEGDPAPFAKALADRLAKMPSHPPDHDKAILPVQQLDQALALENLLHQRALGTKPILNEVVHDLGDGAAVLRPAVFLLNDPNASQTRVELPFPCVWVAPWSKDYGIPPLKDTLVLTAITRDEELIDSLLNEPSILNLYLGNTPTTFLEPGIPHDSYLGEFLMRTKGVARN
ncbi:MAG: aldehyde dehydrogenase [Balneola sp.]|nr:MAG: aldehyde dehydrogenase [Balneola sp.]